MVFLYFLYVGALCVHTRVCVCVCGVCVFFSECVAKERGQDPLCPTYRHVKNGQKAKVAEDFNSNIRKEGKKVCLCVRVCVRVCKREKEGETNSNVFF